MALAGHSRSLHSRTMERSEAHVLSNQRRNKNVRQYLQMNPYVAFGEDIFATENLPGYIVSGEPAVNAFLFRNREVFEKYYERVEQKDAYVLFKKIENRE